MKIVYLKSKRDVHEFYGRDWYKIVKVTGGYALFETRAEYEIWKAQK